MVKRFKFLMAILTIFSIGAIVGCGSSGSKDVRKRTSINTDGIIMESTAHANVKLADSVITDDVTIAAKNNNQKKVVEAVIPGGTEFRDSEGELATPTVSLVQQEGKAEAVKDGKKEVKKVAKAEIKITDENGKKIIPSKPVEVKVKAPNGAKPGEKVYVDIPDGASIEKDTLKQEKLQLVTVGQDGYISIMVPPQMFESMTVIVIIIEKVITQPITGATGGN
jgi:hypothetical protein